MSGPTVDVTIKGGPDDGRTYPMPVNELEIGVRTSWLGQGATITQNSAGDWLYLIDGPAT